MRAVGGGILCRAEIRCSGGAGTDAEHAGDEVNPALFAHGVLHRQRHVPFHGIAFVVGTADVDAVEQRTALNALCTGGVPSIGSVVTRPGGVLGRPVVLPAFPNTDGGAAQRGRGEGEFEMSGLHGVAVRKEVGDEVAPHEGGDLGPQRAVIDRHLRVAVEIVVHGRTVDVGVHARGVLIVQ